MDLTKELADALCTAVALGFIQSAKNHRYIYEVNPEEEKEEGKSSDAEDHMALQKLLGEMGIEVSFEKQESGKEQHPVIMATSKYMMEGVLKGINDELLKMAGELETKINKTTPPVQLKGAYIGGMTDLNKVEFIGPSDLYLYKPVYRKTFEGVAASYENAKKVSNIILEFLYDRLRMPIKKGMLEVQMCQARSLEPIKQPYQKDYLFGSVHGMTNAILVYHPSVDKNMACIELALGKDTCKVASCLPCSLFMWANGTPATATHLGRGDNWNFPQKSNSQPSVRLWEKAVVEVYKTGLVYLKKKAPTRATKLEECTIGMMDKIPKLFLEALTYEDKFIDKMMRVLTN